MLSQSTIDVVVPVFNEEECLPELMKRLLALKNNLPETSIRFIFVNDGSRDRSLMMLTKFAEDHSYAGVINLSRNFGHQMAITAGIDFSSADYVVIIDADLQDPPELIGEMAAKAKEGYDIVYAKRKIRNGETLFKKASAKFFYYLISKLCDIQIPSDTGDFRLITRRVADELSRMRERHRFVRGMVPWIGFNSTFILYDRDARFAGETKYPLRKMIKFSKDAIFSFSQAPLKIASLVGYVTVSIGLLGAVFMLYIKLFTSLAVPGITATLITIVIVGGMQIIMLGIVGEYIGRIFEEIKGRPLYVVAETKNLKKQNESQIYSPNLYV